MDDDEAKCGLVLGLNKIKEILIKNNLLIECNIIDEDIKSISCDSRNIEKSSLFFCKGIYFKEEYLKEAIEKGAIAYVSEQKYKTEGASYFIVSNVLKSMGIISLEFFNHPDRSLEKIGVTGTKGKTTVTYFLNNILEEYTNSKPGLISSIWIYTGVRNEKSHITTPEAMEIEKSFYEMVKSNIKKVTMEVSSQSYKRSRLEGVEFEYGVFLNIDKDHISKLEHPNFEDYLNCKLEFLKHCKNVLINRDTKYLEKVLKAVKGKNVVFFGSNNDADYYFTEIIKEENGFSFVVKNDKLGYSKVFNINMQGRFNIENALAAISVCKMLNIDDEIIRKRIIKN